MVLTRLFRRVAPQELPEDHPDLEGLPRVPASRAPSIARHMFGGEKGSLSTRTPIAS